MNDGNHAVSSHLYRFSLLTFDWEDLTHPTETYVPAILSGVQVYNDYLYIFFGWSTTAQQDLDMVFRTSLDAASDFSWEQVTLDTQGLQRDAFGYALVGDSFYMFGGYTVQGLLNSLYDLNLSTDPVQVGNYDSHDSPEPRFSHTLNSIYDRLYLFGGATDTMYFNDLWEFWPDRDSWNVITGSGQIPTPRAGHGASTSGDTLMVWGGIGPGGLLNDLYKYSVTLNAWELIESESDTVPSPRSDPCVVLSTPYIFIFGGSTEIGLTDELWVFYTGNKTYSLLSSSSRDGPRPSHRLSCSVERVGDGNLHLYVMMGTAHSDEALGSVHYYDFKKGSWEYVLTLPEGMKRNSAYVEKIDRQIVIAGGELWGVYLSDEIFFVNLDNFTTVTLGNLEDFFISGAGIYFENSFYLHGGSFPLGIVHRPRAASNNFIKYDLFTLIAKAQESGECNNCTAQCSLGSIKRTSQTCELCKEGLYSDTYSSTWCEPCKAGFANGRRGASSELQCFPCPQGSYTDEEGSEYCLDCPSAAFCSIGSDAVIYGTEEFEAEVIQPDFYKPQTETVNRHSLIATGAVAGVLLFAITLCFSVPRFRPCLRRIDVYGKIELSQDRTRVIRRKTLLGGSCQMLCICISAFILTQTIASYWIDNLHETKALVPYAVLSQSDRVWLTNEKSFSATIELVIVLENYFADCTNDDACADTINIYERGNADKFTPTCERNQQQNSCEITIKKQEVELNSITQWTFEFSHLKSYCSGIQAKLTAQRHIDKNIADRVRKDDLLRYESMESQHIQSSEGKVFRGSPPTVLYFSAIPSLFTNRTKNDQGTSYHILVDKAPEAGSEVFTTDLQFEDALRIVVEVNRSENGLITTIEPKETWYLLLFALIGSLIGVFEIIEIAKFAADNVQKRLAAKIEHINEIKNIHRDELKYRDQLLDDFK